MSNSRVSILGTEYSITYDNSYDNPILLNADGYTDMTTKRIVIGEKEADCDLEDFAEYQRHVLRHEIIHAYFIESGLHTAVENKTNGVPETYVDWFALQAPKIFNTFKELHLIDVPKEDRA